MWPLAIVIVTVILAYFVWPRKMRGVHGGRANPLSAARVVATPTSQGYHWNDSEHFDFEVVGESFYQNALTAISSRTPERSLVIASIIPDGANKHDNLAVRIDIDGRTVGHLSREDARSFRRRLGAKKLTGQITTCDAEIRGGGARKNGEKLSFGVFLRLKQFG
jgi:hypothetical protein